MIRSSTYERYSRQLALSGFGMKSQEKLSAAKVLVVGAGGLGCPVLQYLAAAGTGSIGIVDFDLIELSNLQRQTIYTPADIGKPKAETAAEKIRLFNPDVQCTPYPTRLTTENTIQVIESFDIVIDGTDNFATRYLLNDACVILGKPLVYGAVLRYEGQAGVFNLPDRKTGVTTNYRDLFPQPPQPGKVPSCSEAGVLGVLPAIIGSIQAAEAIKIITGIGAPLSNRILSYNMLHNTFYEFQISPLNTKDCSIPTTIESFRNFDYEWFCGEEKSEKEITWEALDLLVKEEDLTLIDVREPGELPVVTNFLHLQMPLSRFENLLTDINPEKKIILFCQSGKRSLSALDILSKRFPTCRAFSIKGGLAARKKHETPLSETAF